MTDHTATPWKAVPNGGDDPDTRALLIGKDDQYGDFTMIAEARDFFGEVDGDQEANAAFIVQACNAYDSDQRIIAELRVALKPFADLYAETDPINKIWPAHQTLKFLTMLRNASEALAMVSA